MTENGMIAPTSEQAKEAKEEVRKEQQELMEELTQFDHITRFFKNKCFAFADEEDNTIAISSLVNCEDKFVEAYMVTVGKIYQESRKNLFMNHDFVRTLYLFLTGEEDLLDADGHRINNLVTFNAQMYQSVLKLRVDALALCEAIRQMKATHVPLRKLASFHRLWRHIADLMLQLAVLDVLAERHPNLSVNFQKFQKQIEKHMNTKLTEDQRKKYEDATMAHEKAQILFLNGNCFQKFYQSPVGDMDNNMPFANEMKEAIVEMLAAWEKSISQGCVDVRFFCGICALTVFYANHFSNFADKSVVRKVINASVKVSFFRIIGEELFMPTKFLKREISIDKWFDKKTTSSVEQNENWLKDKNDELFKEIRENCKMANSWIGEFTEKQRAQTESISKLPQWGLDVAELFLKIIRILDTITRDMHLVIRAKRHDNPPQLLRSDAFLIFTAIETLKKVENFLLDNWATVEEGSFLARQQWRKHMLRLLGEARKSYVSTGMKGVSELEATTKRSFFHVAESMCVNEMIAARTLVLVLAYDIGRLETHVSAPNRKQIHDLMSRLETFNSPRRLLRKAAYTGAVLRYDLLCDMYFDTLLVRKPDESDIRSFTNALGGFMEDSKRTGQSIEMLTKFKETIQKKLIVKIGTKIDTDLRVLANPDLAVGQDEKTNEKDLEYIEFLLKDIQKFQVATTVVPIKESVTKWLESHWYAMLILTPNNAKTYTRMMEIAKIKYDLNLIDPGLPQADIDETVDILDLLHNFSSFVTTYSHFSQGYMFIEKASTSKRLHVIQMSDLRTALQKHGIGLLPTAINAAYMLVRNKIQTFLNFLAEDTVRNQVQKYLHEYETMAVDPVNQLKMYKVTWAGLVLKNLGKTAASSGIGSVAGDSVTTAETVEEIPYTYFDMFRSIITQIGNALSLVRMLCQAARELGHTRQELYPQLKKHVDELETMTRGLILTNRKGAPINRNKMHAVHRLGLIKQMFDAKFDDERDYAKMMCVEFKSLLLNSQLPQDRINVVDHFHGVVPALTISHINYMMAHENRVKKTFALKHNKDLVVVDDGFAVGVAFLLHVVDGWEAFSKLNWFHAFGITKKQEMEDLSQHREFSQAIQMKLERIQTELKIFSSFSINFNIQYTAFTTT